MLPARRRRSQLTRIDVVTEAEFMQGGFGFFELLFGDAAIRLDLDGDTKFQAFIGWEFGQDAGVEFHPFLVGDFAGPGKAVEGELFGTHRLC